MAYEWGRLGERRFEQLCRALAVRVLGPGLQAFGDGPDGGREASFDGTARLSTSVGDPWNGYGVLQAKYRRTGVGTRDVDWLHRQLTDELNAWSDPSRQRVSDGRLPEYLIIATNVRLSSAPGRGGIDRIRTLLGEFADRLGLKGWALWEANQLSMYLDAYPDVSARFAEFLTPGDVLAKAIARLDELYAVPTARAGTGVEKNQDLKSLHGFLLHLDDGQPPHVGDVDALDLGVKPAIGTWDSGDDLPPYVARACDADLDWAISRGGVVLLHGRAAAGKSRSALEAVRRVRPQDHLLAPASPDSLRRLLDAGYEVRDAVVWLDDLDRYLFPGGVDLATIQRLCPQGRSDVVVVATIRDEALARIEQSGAMNRTSASGSAVTITIEAAGREILRHFRGRRRVAVGDRLTTAERNAIGSDIQDQRVVDALAADVGFAEYLAAGPALMSRWTVGDGAEFHVGQAIVCAAVDCRRAGFSRSLPGEALATLHSIYLPAGWQHRADLPSVEAGLWWACTPVLAASSCIWPRKEGGFLAADYLVDRAEADEGPLAGRPVPDKVWQYVLASATGSEAEEIGFRAHSANVPAVAQSAFEIGAHAGDRESMFNLAALHHEQSRHAQAEQWYRRAADMGHFDAMVNLGGLLEDLDKHQEAQSWYRRAAEAGWPEAMANLGFMFHRRNLLAEAESWYRRALDADPELGLVAADLAALLETQERFEEAETWWHKAADAGEVDAMFYVGHLLEKRGQTDEARQWWLRAAEGGDVNAMFGLGALAAEAEWGDETASWWLRAAGMGRINAMTGLGILHAERNELDTAEQWWRRAADAGDRHAIDRLARMLASRGDHEQAEQWWARGAELGDANALFQLGLMLVDRGQVVEAEQTLRQAVHAGRSDAVYQLGLLLARQDRWDEAEQLWRAAAEAGDGVAMTSLGIVLADRGAVADAANWWRRAADAGRPGAMELLADLADDEGRPAEAMQWRLRATQA